MKDYTGNKRDLSLYALTKYLKTFKDVKDVRTKIVDDFGIWFNSYYNKNMSTTTSSGAGMLYDTDIMDIKVFLRTYNDAIDCA